MIEPQPVNRAFRQDLLRGFNRGLIEIRMADQRVEEDRPAIADVFAEARRLFGGELERFVPGAVEHRVFTGVGRDFRPALDVGAETRAHFRAHPLEQPLEIMRRAGPVLGIVGADLGEQDRRGRRIFALLTFLRDHRIGKRRHPLGRGHLCRRRLGFFKRRRFRRLWRCGNEHAGNRPNGCSLEFHGLWHLCRMKVSQSGPAIATSPDKSPKPPPAGSEKAAYGCWSCPMSQAP